MEIYESIEFSPYQDAELGLQIFFGGHYISKQEITHTFFKKTIEKI